MRNVFVLGVVAIALACTATANATTIWTDNFDTYTAGSYINGQGGWVDASGNSITVQAAPGGGAGSTQGINNGGYPINWTGNGWDWGTLGVGDKVIARMDFQANGSGQFDDRRVGWITATGAAAAAGSQSTYHFGVQLDNSDNGGNGGLGTYFRDNSGNRVLNAKLIPWETLAPSGSNWYREELDVTKLTSGLGAGGAQVDVTFWPLDGSGNPGTPLTASYGTIDTSALRGFSGTMYPMFKNYNGQPGNADNAYFAIVTAAPEPSTFALAAAALMGLGVMVYRRRK